MDEKMRQLDKKNIEDILVLTPMQEGMLFHYIKDPRSDHYVEQLSLVICGGIDVKVFERAWNVVIETNGMLRSVYRWETLENPVQVLLKRHQMHPGYFDVSHKDAGEKEKFLQAIKVKERKENLDLRERPFRVMLCKTGEDRYEMIISHFHILYDGWSTGIILKEFFKAYKELCRGKELKKTIKTCFKEFVKWVQSRDSKEQETFWKNYLTGLGTQKGFSQKKGRKAKEIANRRTYQVNFEEAVKEEFEDFVKKHRITLAALLYSAWGILLQTYNNSGDVVFGTTVSGRSAKVNGIEEMVGLFINTLPLRVQIEPGGKIGDLLKRINDDLYEREAYEQTSLVTIQECVELESNGELFDTIVVMENYPLESRLMLEESPLNVDSYSMVESTHYNLTVGITIFNGIQIDFAYNRDVFDEEFVIRLSGHFRKVLEEIVKNPGKEVALLELLSAEEKKQLLEEFNDTAADFSIDKTIHGLLEEKAARTPDHIAIAAPSTTHMTHRTYMTYKELNEKSNQLACLLIERGVRDRHTQPIGMGGEAIVGIMVERSIEMVIGIMGILKAGGAYLPIDPEYPEERIRYILCDSSADVLLTTRSFSENIDFKKEVIYIDDYKGRKGIHHSDNLAYIIYTSGTTGRPKGVAVNHAGMVNYTWWRLSTYKYTKTDITLQMLSYVFDGFYSNFYSALLSGGVLVLVPGFLESDIDDIKNLVKTVGGTNMSLVPGMYAALLRSCEARDLEALRFVVLAGEKADEGLVSLSKEKAPHIRLINEYGPTEATVTAAANTGMDAASTAVIGKPITNTAIYLLDESFKPVPIGVPGELYITGPGVARGYLNQPQLTTETFDQDGQDYLDEKIKQKFFAGSRGGSRRIFQKSPLVAEGKRHTAPATWFVGCRTETSNF